MTVPKIGLVSDNDNAFIRDRVGSYRFVRYAGTRRSRLIGEGAISVGAFLLHIPDQGRDRSPHRL